MRTRASNRHFFTLAPLLIALTILLALPAGASAADCRVQLEDSAGALWDVADDDSQADTVPGAFDNPSIDDGGIDTSTPKDGAYDRADAFDDFGQLILSANGGMTWGPYQPANDCTLEEGGREVAFPPATVAGVEVTRKLFVPAAGLAFGRWLNVMRNTGGSPVTVSLDMTGGSDCRGDLGSDTSTATIASSSGDTAIGADDAWAATWDGLPLGDPQLAHVWSQESAAPGIDRADLVAQGPHVGCTQPSFIATRFDQVTIQPGASAIYMHLEAMRDTTTSAVTAAEALSAAPDEIFAGMSASEIALVRNFSRDPDGDGLTGAADNCPLTANATQSDLDGDGAGDECDDDIDGDGLSNATEQGLGSDLRKTDTDGDGRADAGDSCPTLAAATANGCPAFAGPSVDTTAPDVTLTGVKARMKRARFLKGVAPRVACSEACSLRLQVIGRLRRGRIAAAGDLVLSEKASPLGTGTHSARLRVGRKLRRALPRSFAVKLRVVARDAAGNERTISRRIRVT